MQGELPPCRTGCQPAIRSFVLETGASVVYEVSATETAYRWTRQSAGKNAAVLQETVRGDEVVECWKFWKNPKGKWKRAPG